MDSAQIMYVGKRTLEIGLMVSMPVLVVTLVVGFLVSIFQAVTSIRDMTIALVIKLAAVAITLLVCGNWMIQLVMNLTYEIFNHMKNITQ
jgi:flagellar biosynthetic protein FliQ